MIFISKTENTFGKNKHWYLFKTPKKTGIDGYFLNSIKRIDFNPKVRKLISGEKPKVFPLRSGTGQECLLSPYYLTLH